MSPLEAPAQPGKYITRCSDVAYVEGLNSAGNWIGHVPGRAASASWYPDGRSCDYEALNLICMVRSGVYAKRTA